MLIYDCEIIKAMPAEDDTIIEGTEYCKGWRDFENMGVSVICAYDYVEERYRVFMLDNFDEFVELVAHRGLLIGFNNIAFDNQLCLANGIDVSKTEPYDVLIEIWKGAGLGEQFQHPSHLGYGLGACCLANFGTTKSGSGALAPILWQQGKLGKVVDYCLNDVKLTKQLVDHFIEAGTITSHVNGTHLTINNDALLRRRFQS